MINVVVVGGGKVGTHLASMLLAGGHTVKVVEVRRGEALRLQHKLPAGVALCGNGTDPAVLEAAGIRNANVVAAVAGEDEVNLVVTSLARFEFHVPRVIARVNDPRNDWMFTPAMGVDVALDQADLMAHLIAEEMSLGDMMTLLRLRKGQYSLVEEKVHQVSIAVGRTIAELSLPVECVIVAVIRKGELLIPHGHLILQIEDEVLALVHAFHAGELAAILGNSAVRS